MEYSNTMDVTPTEDQLAALRRTWPRIRRRPGRSTKQMVIEVAAQMIVDVAQAGNLRPHAVCAFFRGVARQFVCPTDADYRTIAQAQLRAAKLSIACGILGTGSVDDVTSKP